MGHPNLNESAWDRATSAAARVYWTPTFAVVQGIVGLIAVSTSIIFTADASTPTQSQIAVPILAGLLAVALVFVVVLGFQLVAAPVRQRNELRRAWDSGPVVEPVNVELTIRNYARIAHDNADSMSAMGGYTRSDEAEAAAWSDEVAKFLSAHVPEHARTFLEAAQRASGVSLKMAARADALLRIADQLQEE